MITLRHERKIEQIRFAIENNLDDDAVNQLGHTFAAVYIQEEPTLAES